jgi:hypothetical protein
LGFDPLDEPAKPGRAVYTATDSPTTITVLDQPGRHAVQVTVSSGGVITWTLEWTVGTPQPVQLIALYAALNDDPAAALDAAAATAIGLHPPP